MSATAFRIVVACCAASASSAAAADLVEFNRDIRPILSDTCFTCHGPDKAKRKAGLRLDTEAGAFAKRDGRMMLVPGKPADSELYRRIISTDDLQRMPPRHAVRTLTPQQIETFGRWIEQGARWQPHWSLIPPTRPAPPAVREAGWPRNPVDAFLLARLEREGLRPSPEADRATLIRRATLDLTGLPPAPAEVEAFLADRSPDAYEKVVDRLLASPRYGERMAWEWLEAARYADSNGYQGDRTRTMWPWRDWVVRALNDNMPFDRFTVEQIAGDHLPAPTVGQKIATGFHRNLMLNGEGGRIAEESRVDYVVDRVDTTAAVWMGLTLACSRCHDHKYDPLTQRDYFGLYAYFNSIAETGSVDRSGNASPVMALPTAEQEKRIAELTAQADAQKRLADASTGAEKEAARKKSVDLLAKLDAAKKSVLEVMVMQDAPKPRPTHVLIRGAYDQPGDKVEHGVPAVLPKLPADAPKNRLALARWLVDPGHPLTARVTVNRVWQQFFGTGLVKTAEDFGVQGEPPSHPDLLDWLAVEFVASGWDVKALHRLIVTGAAYRQSSRLRPELRERDPENRLLARFPRTRLPSFVLRDQALAAGGLLSPRMGGPAVKPYQPAGIWEEFSFGKIKYEQDKGESLYRRSLYTFWRRTVGPTNMFDVSPRQFCSVKPTRTNTPLQALILLNDVTYVEAARALAERVLTEAGPSPAERLTFLFLRTTARRPSAEESAILAGAYGRLLEQFRSDPAAAGKLLAVGEKPRDAKHDSAELAAWTALANMVMNLDEVITKE